MEHPLSQEHLPKSHYNTFTASRITAVGISTDGDFITYSPTRSSYGPVSTFLSVCQSQVGIVSRWLNWLSWFVAHGLSSTYVALCFKEIWTHPKMTVLPFATWFQIFLRHVYRHNMLSNLCFTAVDACCSVWQLSLASHRGRLTSTSFAWVKGGNVTSVGLQVTLCDPMWHVSSHSSVATLRTAIHLFLTYLQSHDCSSQPLTVNSCVQHSMHEASRCTCQSAMVDACKIYAERKPICCCW